MTKYVFLILITLSMTHIAYPQEIEPQPLPENVKDNGINICLDSAHQFLFFWHWTVRDKIRQAGFRITGNMQVLNKTMQAGKLSRMREQYDHDFNKDLTRKFTKIPNPEFNTIITYQFGDYQEYTEEEIKTLHKFVRGGGGLVIFGWCASNGQDLSLQKLVKSFGANFSNQKTKSQLSLKKFMKIKTFPDQLGQKSALGTIKINEDWHPILISNDHKIVLAVRTYGKGRIVLAGDDYLKFISKEQKDDEFELLIELVEWASGNSKPVGGSREVPWEYGGVGGAIYPSNKEEVAGVTVFYADNQHEEVIYTIRERTKEVKALLERMIPSPSKSADEFFLMPAAGAGGGWAVNVYTPRSASICCNRENTDALLSIMAHEIAHTMTGPAASDGSTNGMQPEDDIGLFSEAHAGWFQKKVTAELGIESPSHDLSDLAVIDPTLRELDLQKVPKNHPIWGWKKLWFIYSILEVQYGEQFYANWMKEIHELCKDRSKFHEMSWQETLITLSKAVNVDMFPLFEAYGTKVNPPENWNMPPIKSLIGEINK